MDFLYDYQYDAVGRMSNGCILNGGVGSGKSRTGLYYYFQLNGGSIKNNIYSPMTTMQDLYIITTAMKRNSGEWEGELAGFNMSVEPSEHSQYSGKINIVIDSWNNIKKYISIKNAFFIFDEDRVTGNGEWVKTFLKITPNNDWIVLSATPGDSWEQYAPIFIANGFYKNRFHFNSEHILYSRFCSKYPKIEGYYNVERLERLRNKILIDMDFQRLTIPHHEQIYCDYDISKYKYAVRNRWDIFKEEPITQASSLCYVLRRIVNEDESRAVKLLELVEKHPKSIIFYNFDYERELLLHLFSGMGQDMEDFTDIYEVAEWSGHAHQAVPDGDRWVYLVQYTAGCEGWNCIKTDTIIFYSQNYSYKTLAQAEGRINRLNSPFTHLYYYHMKSRSGIDVAISKALSNKKKFNESKFAKF